MTRLLLIFTTVTLLCLPLFASLSHAADTTAAPTPAIYDTLANAKAQIADALKLAKETDRRVLIQWGANWCVWCRALHGLMEGDSTIHQALNSDYVLVLIDVGRKDKNGDLMDKYGVDRKQGIPFLTVLDADGKVIVDQETGALETADKEHPSHDPAKVIAFLEKYATNQSAED